MAVAIWLSSGTMYPFAATWAFPIVTKSCGYLFNLDHPQYRAAFDMLDGAPRAAWEWSITLRRILYPLVAFPFMKVAGFVVGGFITSLLINLSALVALAVFVRKRWGDRAAIVSAWLLATYPGVTYWGALPYANATIVPVSCGLFILLTRIEERDDLKWIFGNALAMGVLVTAYDLLPYFAAAAVIVLAWRRRWRAIPIVAACMASGPLLVWFILSKVVRLNWSNINTEIYGLALHAYLHPGSIGGWVRSLAGFPRVVGQVFLFSNLVFLPVLFLMVLLIARARLSLVERALFIAIALVFLFNNLAPPDPATDQMRGAYIPRIYQPLGVALIVYCARVIGSLETLDRMKSRMVRAAFAFTLVANLSVAFGPVARLPWAGEIYQRFYFHSFLDSMDVNLTRYGRRPLGFCQPQ